MPNEILIEGIETNNLKNINVSIEKKSINLIVGPSGSGKSSLAYDTIAQIGQHEFMAMFAEDVQEPSYKVKSFYNMVASVPIRQSNHNNNTRSTIGTYFGLNRSIGFIFAAILGLNEDIFVLNKESNLCSDCHGLGTVTCLDENRIIDYNVPINKNPFRCWNKYKDFYSQILMEFCHDQNIDSSKTFRELSKKEKNILLFSESNAKYSIRYKKTNAYSRRTTKFYGVMTGTPMLINHSVGKQFYIDVVCQSCSGKKYAPEIDKYKIDGLSIGDFMTTPFSELIFVISKMMESAKEDGLRFALSSLTVFVEKAIELNLGHLFLHRAIPTLSGGELQRLRMVQVFNTQLSDLMIVLDEPLAGLSGSEKKSIYENVLNLSNKHTVIIVDHSDMFASKAKKVIALGEGGGSNGGNLINANKYLLEQKQKNSFVAPVKNEIIQIILDNPIYQYSGVDIHIAKNRTTLITGQSGIGKSTLLREYFPQCFEHYSYISQKPLMGNKNSSVATALDIFGKILEIYATRHKKDKKFFSNLTGNDGMCQVCQGAGYVEYGCEKSKSKIECKECEGTGFDKKLKNFKVANKSVFDVWKMTLDEAYDFFLPLDEKIAFVLKEATTIMLGHLKVGQPTSTLSGGENIRVKILKSIKSSANILGIDEPFKGLSKTEIDKVAVFIDKIRQQGKSIVVIDHSDGIENYFSEHIVLSNNNGILTNEV